MITQNDYALLLSIKQSIPQSPSTPIDKIENFHKELKPYMFKHNAILNNHLVDYVARKSTDSFEHIMETIEKKDVPLGFLAQYYLLGKEQEKVFKHFITWGKERSWDIIEKHRDEKEKELLQEAWLRFSDGIEDVPKDWLNGNFHFIESHYENLGEERCLALCVNGYFEEISSSNGNLLDCIINYSAFQINLRNLSVIISVLTNKTVDTQSLNYSWCLNTNNKNFIGYITDNLEDTLSLFSHNGKKENSDGILALLNTKEIALDFKETYLSGQENRVTEYNEITEEALELATKLFLVEPTWNNVVWYFQKKEELTEELISYIEHFTVELSGERVIKTEDAQPLFESVVVCPNITDSTLSLLLKAFTGNLLDGVDVTKLSENRLTILLDKFPFTAANTEVLSGTPIFGKYLIAYPNEMLSNIASDFFKDRSVSEIVLTAKIFSLSQKEKLMKVIPESHLYSSIEIANAAIETICNQVSLTFERDTLVEIINKSTLFDKRLRLVVTMIQNTFDDNEIADLLKLLGGAYAEIADREKCPKLNKNMDNGTLLDLLTSKGFISSFNEDKDGVSWRIYPPKS